MENYFSELALNVDCVACISCYQFLQCHLVFIKNCLSTEKKIKDWYTPKTTNSNDQTEFNSLPSMIQKYELEIQDKIKLNVQAEEGYNWVENLDTKVKIKNESFLDMKEHMLDYSKLRSEEGDCGRFQDIEHVGSELYDAGTKKAQADSEVTHHKYVQQDLQNFKSNSEMQFLVCEICDYHTKIKRAPQKHMITHKSILDAIFYKCEVCALQTRHKDCFQGHMLVHKNSSEVTLYKCELCQFQTKYKTSVRRHILTHKKKGTKEAQAASEITDDKYVQQDIQNCNSNSEMQLFVCETCDYRTKIKRALQRHMIIHKCLGRNILQM